MMFLLTFACTPEVQETLDSAPAALDSAPPVFDLDADEVAIAEGWVAAGQPDEARVQELVAFGYLDFSLREAHEDPFDEPALVAQGGGEFKRTETTKDLLYEPEFREELYLSYDALLESGETVYLHCRTGDRVGATWALYHAEHLGYPLEEAIALGRDAGLLSLERAVLDILGEELEDVEYDDWEQ